MDVVKASKLILKMDRSRMIHLAFALLRWKMPTALCNSRPKALCTGAEYARALLIAAT